MSDLARYIERVERIEEEIRAMQADRAAIYAEAKASGFDPKIMRKVVAERRMKTQDRLEQEALMDTYRHELGMLADTPLGGAALKAAKDNGRAAPRAAGVDQQDAPWRSDVDPATRPVASPASPDPHTQVDVSPSQHCVECGCEVTPLDAIVLGTKRPLCQPCFVSLTGRFAEGRDPLDSPPDIPPFLDRREKQADLEEFTGART